MTADTSISAEAERASAGAACDVVVVGAGAAGLAAAVAAAEAGAAVTLIEKLPGLRGTTSWSVGSVAAAGTRLQLEAGIADDPAAFAEDIILADPRTAEPAALVQLLAREAGPVVTWLERLGVVFVGPYPEPPNRVPRMHNAVPNGRAYLRALWDEAQRRGVTTRFDARVVQFLRSGERVTGVVWRDAAGREHPLLARGGVVLAAGDFSGSDAMRQRHLAPAAAAALPINRNSTGEGHALLEGVGAVMRRMEAVYGPQLRFPAPPREPWIHRLPRWRWLLRLSAAVSAHAPRALITPLIRQLLLSQMGPAPVFLQAGAVLADSTGKALPADRPAEALALSPGATGWLLGDRALADRFQAFPHFISTAPGIAFAYFRDYERGRPDLVRWADDVGALAARTGTDAALLAEALQGRSGPFFALGPVCAMLTVTEGGAAIDAQCRVLDAAGQPIPGLHAAGATGQGGLLLKGHGLHLMWALVSGRTAGRAAALPATAPKNEENVA
jgi:fumarate reductase flavoprotein subunit